MRADRMRGKKDENEWQSEKTEGKVCSSDRIEYPRVLLQWICVCVATNESIAFKSRPWKLPGTDTRSRFSSNMCMNKILIIHINDEYTARKNSKINQKWLNAINHSDY